MAEPLPDPSSRILVTGAEGFVGRFLVAAIGARFGAAAEVFEASRHPEPGRPSIALDVTDIGQVRAAVSEVRPTAVVHLAAVSAVPLARAKPDHAWAVNLHGTLNLARAVLDLAPRARFLYVSTSEVYGGTFRARGIPLGEDAPLDPANTYAATKAAADLAVGQLARDGLSAMRFRPFNHTGPGQGEDFVIPAFAAQVARIERGLQPPTLDVGNLDAIRDFLDVRDVVDAYVRALALDDAAWKAGAVVNLCSGMPRRIRDALDGLLAAARLPIEVRSDPARLRPNDTPIALGDARFAADLLGWQPQIAWETTLADVLDHWRVRVAPAAGR